MTTTEYEYIALAFKGGYRATNAPKSPQTLTESEGIFSAGCEIRKNCGIQGGRKKGTLLFLPVIKFKKSVEYRARENILHFQKGMTTAEIAKM